MKMISKTSRTSINGVTLGTEDIRDEAGEENAMAHLGG